MDIIVGSLNPVKISAVQQAFETYCIPVRVTGISVISDISAQPFSLEEIARGARNSAKNAFKTGSLSVGVESGIFQLNERYFDTCQVALYDGYAFCEGGAPYFEVPLNMIHSLKHGTRELGDFFDGKGIGAIGVLTGGVITRQQQILPAAIIAVGRYLHHQNYTH